MDGVEVGRVPVSERQVLLELEVSEVVWLDRIMRVRFKASNRLDSVRGHTNRSSLS